MDRSATAADWLEFAELFPPSVDLLTIDDRNVAGSVGRRSTRAGKRSANSGQSAAVVLSNRSAFSYVTHVQHVQHVQ